MVSFLKKKNSAKKIRSKFEKIHHPQLGLLAIDGEWLVKILSMDGREVKMTLASDGNFPLGDALGFGLAISEALPKYAARAKSVAATQLVSFYNARRHEYLEKQEDGSFRTVVKPKLNANEFANLLTLTAVSIYSSGLVTFWFEDCDLFWGHDISVVSVDGVDLSDAHASIVGYHAPF